MRHGHPTQRCKPTQNCKTNSTKCFLEKDLTRNVGFYLAVCWTFQEPRRLWRRYLVYGSEFAVLVMLESLGLRKYPDSILRHRKNDESQEART
jgi:hypothetical protein